MASVVEKELPVEARSCDVVVPVDIGDRGFVEDALADEPFVQSDVELDDGAAVEGRMARFKVHRHLVHVPLFSSHGSAVDAADAEAFPEVSRQVLADCLFTLLGGRGLFWAW